jgi:aminoacyl tRNA synthase complex-interacting multifunctional protein 1
VTRYFDHIQCRPPIRASAESFGDTFRLLAFDLENAPKTERKTEPPKKKEKASKETVSASAQDSTIESAKEASNSSAPFSIEGKEPKKDRKDKHKAVAAEPVNSKGSSNKKGNAAKPQADDEPVPSMIDLRVGHIVDGEFPIFLCHPSISTRNYYTVIKHPDADGLYVEVFFLVH